jgi:hypothetical protein
VLTFEVEQFSALSARRGQSARVWWMIRSLAVRRGVLRVLGLLPFDPVLF